MQSYAIFFLIYMQLGHILKPERIATIKFPQEFRQLLLQSADRDREVIM